MSTDSEPENRSMIAELNSAGEFPFTKVTRLGSPFTPPGAMPVTASVVLTFE